MNVVLGIACGWRVTGRRVGTGFSEAVSAGLTGVAALVFWGLFAQAFNQMLADALERKYRGPFEAIMGMFELAMEYSLYLLNGTVIGIVVIGGLITGIVANWVANRYG